MPEFLRSGSAQTGQDLLKGGYDILDVAEMIVNSQRPIDSKVIPGFAEAIIWLLFFRQTSKT